MISLGSQYLDYGLTGGFFIFLAGAMLITFDTASTIAAINQLKSLTTSVSAAGLETTINGLIASLFVVCLFAVGLILDLFGSIFVAWEVSVFSGHFHRNKAWLEPLLERYRDYLRDDLTRFMGKPPIKLLSFRWRDVKAQLAFQALRSFPQMRRVEGILTSHLLLTTDREKTETMLDQLRTCRLARAVASGTMLFTFPYVFWKGIDVSRSVRSIQTDEELKAVLLTAVAILAVLFATLFLSLFIVRQSYSKFCHTLFSSLFILGKQVESK
jgi:hypothetical protein